MKEDEDVVWTFSKEEKGRTNREDDDVVVAWRRWRRRRGIPFWLCSPAPLLLLFIFLLPSLQVESP